MNWIKTTEKLPPIASWVIGWSNERKTMMVFLDSMTDDGPQWLGWEGDLREDEIITHWIPEPEAPEN